MEPIPYYDNWKLSNDHDEFVDYEERPRTPKLLRYYPLDLVKKEEENENTSP